ncbi:flap endonuclease-1 [Methanobrevibacter sp. DSM 116169]|uniref:flap endonuclease-1 n=1 Tax=Methanobrevibacter sp. DSM 116169 TaxID=3242727 RepID=UPI0038FC2C3D
MGVKFKDIIETEKINFKDLDSRIIAIDAFNIIYQFLSGIRQQNGQPLMDSDGNVTSHLSGLLYRNSSIIDKGIKLVYVFDGESSIHKQKTILKRREIRNESEKKWKAALDSGDDEEARKYAIRSSKMTPYIIESSKKLLNLMGIPYVQASGEGEAQASYMVQKGDAWAVGSQDYDCLLFGADKIVRNLTLTSKIGDLELLKLKDVLNKLDLTREDLVNIALLVGTDFNEGKKGIGAKTGLKLLKDNKIDKAIEELNNESDEDLDEIKNIFLNPDVNTDYKIKWKNPNEDGLVEFLSNQHGFSKERVVNASRKLKKLNNSQKSLEAWF